MKVKRLNIRTVDKETKSLQKAVCIKGMGIEGDKNAKGGEKQLSLLPLHIREEIEEGKINGLCIPRFTENISYVGNSDLSKGDMYKIGDVLIQISSTRKKCFPECQNIIKNKPCTLVKSVSYAKIISGGIIELNDEIEAFKGKDDDF
ncbi:MOSC domain-containing protein [Gudongella sp. DL1XJH-153]|uniref:MOSC domain-containing protein n=1 Tax=Gudongella sp. DL1XJH-153 TaxID=3409804 RepID=UPI003BB6F65C